jgi:hypothetical protein
MLPLISPVHNDPTVVIPIKCAYAEYEQCKHTASVAKSDRALAVRHSSLRLLLAVYGIPSYRLNQHSQSYTSYLRAQFGHILQGFGCRATHIMVHATLCNELC